MAELFFAGAAVPADAEVGVAMVNNQGYKVYINDSSVYMHEKSGSRGDANVIIAKYTGHWSDPYPVEVYWGAGFAVYRLDANGNRLNMENQDFGLAIANYMSEHF